MRVTQCRLPCPGLGAAPAARSLLPPSWAILTLRTVTRKLSPGVTKAPGGWRSSPPLPLPPRDTLTPFSPEHGCACPSPRRASRTRQAHLLCRRSADDVPPQGRGGREGASSLPDRGEACVQKQETSPRLCWRRAPAGLWEPPGAEAAPTRCTAQQQAGTGYGPERTLMAPHGLGSKAILNQPHSQDRPPSRLAAFHLTPPTATRHVLLLRSRPDMSWPLPPLLSSLPPGFQVSPEWPVLSPDQQARLEQTEGRRCQMARGHPSGGPRSPHPALSLTGSGEAAQLRGLCVCAASRAQHRGQITPPSKEV